MPRALPLGAAIAALLVAFGVATTPGLLADTQGWIGVGAIAVVLAAYGLAGLLAAPATARHAPEATLWAGQFGLAAGAVYAAEILLEYAVLPADNTAWGLVEFGLVFLIVLAAGAVVGWRTRRAGAAALAGLWTAMAASLIWYAVVLAAFYAFRGGERQLAVLRAEGDLEDFRRSGAASLQVFLMGDFLGAGVFHLLFSPLIGLVLGGLGGLVGLAARRLAGGDAGRRRSAAR